MPEPETSAVTNGATRSNRDVEILARVGRSLLGTVDLEEQLGLVLGLASEALGAGRGSVMLVDPDSGELEVRAAAGLPEGALAARVPLGQGISGWVARHDEAVVLHGGVADPRFEGIDPTLESALSLPLSVDGAVLGVLNLVRRTGDLFSQDDLRLAASLADLAALAIEKARLYAALREREERVSELLGAAIRAQEQERRRIAADIHDGFLQDLTALFLGLEMVKHQLDRGRTDEALAGLAGVKQMAKDEMNALREFIFQVRPPSLDEVGLGPTLKEMVERVAADNELAGEFRDAYGRRRLPEAVETILYRTAQEALRNVVKHARACSVRVALEREGRQVTLTVADDGQGIDPEVARGRKPRHYGIDTMRERVELAGGRFSLGPRPEGGTELRATIPVETPRAGGGQ